MDAHWGSTAVVQLLEGGLLWAVLGVGCYACYTDVRWRRLSNKATWGLLGMGLVGHSAFWLLGMSGLVQVVGLWAVSFGVGYLLYRYGLWAAGDAKLFMAASAPSVTGGSRRLASRRMGGAGAGRTSRSGFGIG